ncbi:hypothetical protein D1007_57719 [Hordeum vulgare]|nr:hypothetical protein D1007_57719 [Hordeum vulgare]
MVTQGGESSAPGRTSFSVAAALRWSLHNHRLHGSAAALPRQDAGRGTPPADAAARGGLRWGGGTLRSGAGQGLHRHPLPGQGKDPVDEFFKTAKKPPMTSPVVDGMAADVQAAADAVLAEPLQFDEESLLEAAGEALQLDSFSPTLLDYEHFNRATPSSARTMEVQLGAVTSRVSQLELMEASGSKEPRLFHECRPPLLAMPPTRRSVPPPKSRAQATPTRHNARQGANTSTVPVAQRASLRLMKELGLLGPREKMT